MQIAEFLVNINDLYRPQLTSAQQEFYRDFLKNFTDHQLGELWTKTAETHQHTSPPSIGKLKDYSAGVSKLKVVSDQQNQGLERLTELEILNTPLGRLALKEGWADSYIRSCKANGIPDQGFNKHLEYQTLKHKAEEAFKTLNPDSILDKPLINLYNSMRKKNEDLKNKYAHLWQDVLIDYVEM
jgi:hypothetical protein